MLHRAAAILDSIPAHILRIGDDRRFKYVNRAMADHIGLPAEQVIGRTLADLGVSPALADHFWAVLKGVFDDALPVEFEHRGAFGDGTRWLLTRVMPEPDDGGTVRTALAVTTDITDLKTAQAERQQTAARFEAFMRHAPAVMWIKDADGRVVAVSDKMAELFGGAERWLGKTDHDVLPKQVADVVAAHDRQVRETRVPLEIVEEVPTADGRLHPWLVVKFPIPRSDGRVSTGGVALDLSERRKAEEERRKAEQRLYESLKLESLGVLAGGIAHDFNNLLTSMLGYASLAGMELSAGRGAALPAYLTQIETAARPAADLCKQMLAYAGKGQFQVQAVGLNKLVEEMAQLLQASVSKKAVLRILPSAEQPTVTCDTTQIRQVVLNLITNASDAIGDRSGVISVATGVVDADAKYLTDLGAAHLTAGRYAYLEVSDTGCGMSADTAARMFEPFYTTKPAGRGLGLSAIQGIVRGHRGAVRVYSEVGRGTTFKILLPTTDQSPARDAAGHAAGAAAGRGRLVLVIDDEEDVRVLVRKVLERYGFAVALAADGRTGEAEYRGRRAEVDLVLCDLTMPHQDGGTTFRRLRQLDPGVRVVLMSGFSADEATAGLNGMGLQGFLRKPFRVEELAEAVFAAVGP
jgi:PAS domain S-box-containing protein